MKKDFVRAYYLAFDWSGWIAFIKSKIFITKGIYVLAGQFWQMQSALSYM